MYLRDTDTCIHPARENPSVLGKLRAQRRGEIHVSILSVYELESGPVMAGVWKRAGRRDFAIRRIIDTRLALTLRHHGVTEFATSNLKDFSGFGFKRIWNPIQES